MRDKAVEDDIVTISSSSLDSLAGPGDQARGLDAETHASLTRHVWERYTSGSDLGLGRTNTKTDLGTRTRAQVETPSRSSAATLESKAKAKTVPSKGGDGDCVDDRRKTENLVRYLLESFNHIPFIFLYCQKCGGEVAHSKLADSKNPVKPETRSVSVPKDYESDEDTESWFLFGLTRREVLLLALLGAVCLLLYTVLLVMTVKAASCSDTLEDYVRTRQQELDQFMESVSVTKHNSEGNVKT